MDKQYRIFISHGGTDSWIGGQIARCINDCGASTFLGETDIAKGDDYKLVIKHEISRSDELIALFTPWSAQRSWVWLEIGAAWGQEKRIVAVLYGISLSELDAKNKAILEDYNVLNLNEFESYLKELRQRISGVGDA